MYKRIEGAGITSAGIVLKRRINFNTSLVVIFVFFLINFS